MVQGFLRHLGLEVRRLKGVYSEETVLRSILAARFPVAVMDVGANRGQFASLIRKTGFKGVIVSFEALPDVHSLLSVAAASDPHWIIAPCAALGGRQGHTEIRVSRNSVSSSVLPMHPAHIEAAPDSVYIASHTVRMERLDDLAPDLVPAHGDLMLKIDTQGYEKEVLKGATALLQRVGVIQVEMSLVPLYEGAPSFTEMVSFVESLGYEIFSIVPGFRNMASGQLLQVDGFFVRK
jgi:FkbM family methyltransferase